jgi:carboxylesterase
MTATERLHALARHLVILDEGPSRHLVGEGDPSPISIDGDPGRPRVLALHGFAGTPREVSVVTDMAARLGLTARAPRLPGHTADVRDLMNVGWRDWVEAASAAFRELADPPDGRVVVSGLSLGALLATHLAATYPERVAGLVVLANAGWLHWSSPKLPLWLCEKFKPFGNRFYIPKNGADIRDPKARAAHLTYDLNPMRSAVEVLRASRIVRAELSNVSCPTLVIHGRLDRVCPASNAHRFAERLGTFDVEVRVMPRSGHIVSADVDRSEVAIEIEGFLRRVTPA